MEKQGAERTRHRCSSGGGSSSAGQSCTTWRSTMDGTDKNMIEPVINRIEPLNGTGFPDRKCKFEMAVKDIQTGALGVRLNSESSENEIPVDTSEMEHQTASQVYFIPLDIVCKIASERGAACAAGLMPTRWVRGIT